MLELVTCPFYIELARSWLGFYSRQCNLLQPVWSLPADGLGGTTREHVRQRGLGGRVSPFNKPSHRPHPEFFRKYGKA